jgi:LytR cell envelope-related transcriptional attenuator
VPDGVTRARVTIGGVSGEVDARDNVVGGVLPFPYSDYAKTNVELFRDHVAPKPRVGVVNAGGAASDVLATIEDAGYRTSGEPTPGVKDQAPTVVYWRPDRTTQQAATLVAELVAADDLVPVDDERTPRPVLVTDAAVVVVVGSG